MILLMRGETRDTIIQKGRSICGSSFCFVLDTICRQTIDYVYCGNKKVWDSKERGIFAGRCRY
jgi:hypothetical protein